MGRTEKQDSSFQSRIAPKRGKLSLKKTFLFYLVESPEKFITESRHNFFITK